MVCPSPPAGGGSSWADCSVGLDPSKNSGDLLWTEVLSMVGCSAAPVLLPLPELALGPTADIGFGFDCQAMDYGGSAAVGVRLNGWGNTLLSKVYPDHSLWMHFLIGPHNEMVFSARAASWMYDTRWLDLISANNQAALSWYNTDTNSWPPQAAQFGPTQLDALGNVFSVVTTTHATSLDAGIQLPAAGSYMVRGGPGGESLSTTHIDSFAPDQQGGLYLYGPLANTVDFGCGPLIPAGQSTYLARVDASSSCLYNRTISTAATVTVLPDTAGGALLSATSAAALDLGCGALPAAPAGSTFITRLSPQGTCVFAAALDAPNLTIALDPGDRVVASGLVDATPVDLGGGPLMPVGVKDFVIAELDPTGAYLWSGRYGGAGVTLSSTSLTVATTGNLHLLTSYSGAVDFGGGPVTAAATDTVIASLSSDGTYRMGRAITIVGNVSKGFDGCGGFVVVGADPAFDVGCGKVLPQIPMGPMKAAVARFAP